MISTPLRATEAAELRIPQVNFQRKEILLSAKQTKNAQAFTMPATDIALNIINKSSTLEESSRVFSFSSKYDSKMKSWSHFNKVIRNASGVLDFNLHDLMRSFSTIIEENTDYGEAIIDSLLNHSQASTRQGVIAHYQLAKYVKKGERLWGGGQIIQRQTHPL